MPSIQATSRKNALISFIEQCDTGSGFVNTLEGNETTLKASYHAIFLLNASNKLDIVDSDLLIEWVNSSKNADNGFGNTPGSNSEIYSTYYAIYIFSIFNVEVSNETYDWVAACQNGTSGFGEKINETGALFPTYFGLESMYYNSTDLTNYNFVSWLLGRQNTNAGSEGYGGFATDGNSSNVWGSWAALGSLSRLGTTSGYLVNPLVSWLSSGQNNNSYDPDYGGFSSTPSGIDYSLLNTYSTLYSLDTVGAAYLSSIDRDAVINWIIDLQNEDGGFRVNAGDADSSLAAAYYVYNTLTLLGESLLGGVPWEFGFALPLWLWVLIGLGIALVAIGLIKKYQ